jgi:hypothetical protein
MRKSPYLGFTSFGRFLDTEIQNKMRYLIPTYFFATKDEQENIFSKLPELLSYPAYKYIDKSDIANVTLIPLKKALRANGTRRLIIVEKIEDITWVTNERLIKDMLNRICTPSPNYFPSLGRSRNACLLSLSVIKSKKAYPGWLLYYNGNARIALQLIKILEENTILDIDITGIRHTVSINKLIKEKEITLVH